MIGYLRGTVIKMLRANALLLDVQGVGYEINTPTRSSYQGDCTFYIHTQVREDAITLFGFDTLHERDVFLKLITVPGVGAKVGLNLLSIGPLDRLIDALACGDTTFLSQGDGIGPKLAKRLAVEMKDKTLFSMENIIPGPGNQDTQSSSSQPTQEPTYPQALSALTNLGYPEMQAANALRQVRHAHPEEQMAIEEWVKLGLKQLAMTGSS